MPWWGWTLLGGLAAYLVLVAALLLLGRREHARAAAGLVPDCAVLFRRLLGDRRVPRRAKLALGGLLAYLALPIDLIPDFLPVVGQLDDAILVVLVLRLALRDAGPALVEQHWPGPPASLKALLRLIGPPLR